MNCKRILFIEPPPERRVGGIETALSGWATTLSDSGLEVRRCSDPPASELEWADAVHFHGLWERSHPTLRNQCHSLGKPYVVSPHGMLEPWAFAHKRWKKIPYLHLCELPSLKRAAAVIATSGSEAQGLKRWFKPEQIWVLPLGVAEAPAPDYNTARAALNWSRDERVVVFLSRLHEKKGLHVLIAAWRRILPLVSFPVRLVIVGEGDTSYVEPLKRETGRMSDAKIDWVGPQWGDKKWPWLQGADCFCLPSFSENFGLVVPEALLVGTPVVTTPGTPWADLGRGLPVTIVEPEEAALADALVRVLRAGAISPEIRAETHTALVAGFGWSRLAKDYVALYQSLATASR